MFHFLSRLVGRKAACPPCPHCSLLVQARQLVELGYYVGAVATARCELDAKLKATIYALGSERPDSWHGHAMAIFLHRQGLLTLSQARRVSAAWHLSGPMIRSVSKCHPVKANRMLREIEAVVAMLDRAPSQVGVVALAA